SFVCGRRCRGPRRNTRLASPHWNRNIRFCVPPPICSMSVTWPSATALAVSHDSTAAQSMDESTSSVTRGTVQDNCILLQYRCINPYDDLVMGTGERRLATAEELYGGQGIDAVSLREIQRASGVKNVNALQYHFGDRNGLLTALLEKHSHDVELRRHALLDRY